MKLVIGLGNPGKKYQNTRHNLGFMVLDYLVQKKGLAWRTDAKRKAAVAFWPLKSGKIMLAKPQTMMNASGEAVARLMAFYRLKPENLWVIHDDLDLSFGKIRVQQGRGAAGHKGVASIIQKLKTKDFHRFRLGIGHPGDDEQAAETYVLTAFHSQERKMAEAMVKEAAEVVLTKIKVIV